MLKSQPKRIIKLIAAAAACATLLPFGQIRGETESAEAMPEPKVEVGEEQIEKAVSASFKIAGIQEQIQEDLQGIEDQDVIQARIQEAEAEMIKILSELGLDREQYIGIMQAVEQDQALLAAFIQEMQRQQPPEEQADPPPPPWIRGKSATANSSRRPKSMSPFRRSERLCRKNCGTRMTRQQSKPGSRRRRRRS